MKWRVPARQWLPVLLLVLAVVRLWVLPMWSSFWVDEMGTAFVLHHGGDHPSFAAAPQVPKSIYYYLPRAAERLLGFSEPVYRLPSLLLMLAALGTIAWLAARLIHPAAGWLAVFTCFTMRGFNYQAADARPYALGTFVGCAALFFLVRWLDSGRVVDAALFLVSALLLWRVQLIFWPFYVVIALYSWVRLFRRERVFQAWQAALVFALLGCGLVPVLVDALRLYKQAAAHVVVTRPSAGVLVRSLRPGLLALCGAGSWLVAKGLRVKLAPGRTEVALPVAWWLSQPLGLFAFSWFTGNSVFVPRYLALSLPGTALLGTALAARFLPARFLRYGAILMGVTAVAINGQWGSPHPFHHNSDWRAAAERIRSLGLQDGVPVICPSPFVEARPPVWSPGYALPGFLYAHLDAYRIPGTIYPFPFEESVQAVDSAAQFATEVAPQKGYFLLYGGIGQVEFWRAWFTRHPALSEWTSQELGPFRDVNVVVFRQAR